MDNLPKDPSNQNNNNNNPPQPFGSGFNPHTNPVDPNNPYQSQPPQQTPNPPVPNLPNTPNFPNVPENPDSIKHEHYSEAAQNKPRDEHGHFIHTNPDPQTPIQPGQTPPTTPTSQTTPNPSFLPPIIEINQNTKPTDKEDPPLFGFFLTNPVTYLRKFLSKLLKRQMITLRIPVLALIVVMVGIGGFGVGFKSGLNYAVGKLFPNFSPILHRSITAQGIIQKSTKGYYLQANDKDKTLWTLIPKSQNVNLADFQDQKVEVKGNMTPTPNLIEVSEVTSFESPSPKPLNSPNPPNAPNPAPSETGLPNLYSNLTWEITQSKTLLFTSGKRRIEQGGIYLESALVPDLPQAFLDYYTQNLQNLGFKETLNSSEPAGITITYAKDELFLTFGVKNIYSGSGDTKKLIGYKAFIEHN
ncbi:MAG: hypothetical protein Q7R49_00020 [Candidatus Daviesbacteria bacterium]|nr:hypothetical protein [Candidatus Daviesbacteria bacterium]